MACNFSSSTPSKDREKFPEVAEHWDSLPYWGRYLDNRVASQTWTGAADVWLTADADDGVLRRLVIEGLKGKREAQALRSEVFRYRTQTGRRITPDEIGRLAEELFNPSGYPHQRQFAAVLRDVRSYFRWENGEPVESDGKVLPISRMNLPAEDIELLRQVFRRLPPIGAGTIGDTNPIVREKTAKDLKSARKRVKELGSSFADAGFTSWVDQCLQTKTDKWSRARDPLYDHYKAWIRRGGHGQNSGEKAEAKATALTEVKWGRLMRLRFPDAWRQDKRSIFYRVVIKRGA
jgi:hypothetical protein